jgi:hypothetical protein
MKGSHETKSMSPRTPCPSGICSPGGRRGSRPRPHPDPPSPAALQDSGTPAYPSLTHAPAFLATGGNGRMPGTAATGTRHVAWARKSARPHGPRAGPFSCPRHGNHRPHPGRPIAGRRPRRAESLPRTLQVLRDSVPPPRRARPTMAKKPQCAILSGRDQLNWYR